MYVILYFNYLDQFYQYIRVLIYGGGPWPLPTHMK